MQCQKRMMVAILMVPCVFATTTAAVAAQRTFVASTGVDVNPCTLTQPCRGFGRALTQTDPGGEIVVLDSAGYGPVTINQSVSIVSPAGVYAGISVFSGVGIAISVSFSDIVTLKGLTITGLGGDTGIALTSPGTLHVVDCTVKGMAQNGISITPSSSGTIVITDTTVSSNAGAGIFTTASGSGVLTVTMNRVKALNNGFNASGFGVRLVGTSASFTFATIDSSVLDENGTGLRLEATTPNVMRAFVVASTINNNKQSIFAGTSTNVRLERTSVFSYTGGGITNNGTITSYADNAIVDAVTGTAIVTTPLK